MSPNQGMLQRSGRRHVPKRLTSLEQRPRAMLRAGNVQEVRHTTVAGFSEQETLHCGDDR